MHKVQENESLRELVWGRTQKSSGISDTLMHIIHF